MTAPAHGPAGEIAATAVFLCGAQSDDASGAIVDINGGTHLHGGGGDYPIRNIVRWKNDRLVRHCPVRESSGDPRSVRAQV